MKNRIFKSLTSLLLVVVMIASMLPVIPVTVNAATTNTYVKVDLNDIESTDKVIIVSTKGTANYALYSGNGSSKAPTAVAVTVSNDTVEATDDAQIFWNISNENGTLTIYPDGSTSTWLYCTSTNNGVRIGTNTNKAFTMDSSGYLKNTATSRYLGVYNAQDWRCYTNTTGNTAGQTFAFFKLQEITEPDCEHTKTTTLPAVEATCTTAGKTAGEQCSDCGYDITPQEDIPALGHNYVDGICTVCQTEVPKTLTITRGSFTTTGGYMWHDWSAETPSGDTITGKGFIYASTTASMQMNGSKTGNFIYNEVALPGAIVSVKLTTASGTNRTYDVLTSDTAYDSSTNKLTATDAKKTVTTDGVIWEFDTTNRFFAIVLDGTSAGYLASIEITYKVDASGDDESETTAPEETEAPTEEPTEAPEEPTESETTAPEEPTESDTTATEEPTESETTESPEPSGESEYVKVTTTPTDWSGTYLIVYEDGSVAFDGSLAKLDAIGNTVPVTIENGKIVGNNYATSVFIIEQTADGYTIKTASGNYIGQTSDANGLQSSGTAYNCSLSLNDDGSVNIVSGGAYLRYNSASNQTRFRFYKSSTYSGQKAIALYKLVEATPEAPETPEEPKISNYGVTLDKGVTIKVEYTVTQAWLDANPGAKAVFNSTVLGTVELGALVEGKNNFNVTLTPKAINAALTLEIVVGEETVKTHNVSFSKYCEKAAAFNNEKLNALLAAIVNYGKAATGELTELTEAFTGIEDYDKTENVDVFGGISASLAESANVRLGINKANVGENYTVVVTLAGKEIANGNLANYDLLIINGIYAADFDEEITITVKDGETTVASASLTFNQYLKALYTNVPATQTIAAAAYQYGLAVEAYIAQ